MAPRVLEKAGCDEGQRCIITSKKKIGLNSALVKVLIKTGLESRKLRFGVLIAHEDGSHA